MAAITLNNAHATMQTDTTASSHVAMIKRFAKFAGALALIAIAGEWVYWRWLRWRP